jgi:hypothetical protein
MKYIVLNIEEPANVSLLGNMVLAASNLCRGRPSPKWALVEKALPLLNKVVQNLDPFHFAPILLDACWAFSYLCDGENERIHYSPRRGNETINLEIIS